MSADKLKQDLQSIVSKYLSDQKDHKQDHSSITFPILKRHNLYDFCNLINPIRRNLDYQGIARRIFIADDLKRKYNICG